jgi:hypothetical protein
MNNVLPPPWQPGYALPSNVADEGLQRHAYVSAMTPRGTFDDPNIAANTGYATPGYVKSEPYGQGARTTKMARRGTYDGPRVPHWLNRSAPSLGEYNMTPIGIAAVLAIPVAVFLLLGGRKGR